MDWTACQCFRRQSTQNTAWLLPVQMEYQHLKVSAINKDCLWVVAPLLGHILYVFLCTQHKFMPAVRSLDPHEGMCRLEMKLHGNVLIYAISFHQRWLLWHFMPAKRGNRTDWYSSCQITDWYTVALSRWGIDDSLRACESDTDL